MSYNDRLRELKYTAPSGAEFIAQFSALNRTGGKKAPVSEFPGQNQGAVQDLGNITPTFPINCYISGVDYDLEADRFWEALHESGPGTLEHPRWGNISVLPIPETQTEQFVDGAGRSVFQITFIRAEETQFDYPTSEIDYPTQVSASVDVTATTITDSLPEEITDTKTLAGLKDNVQAGLDSVVAAFDQITGIADDTRQEINQTVRDIENNIDTLVQAPADLMEAVVKLYRLPAAQIINIQEKLEGYKSIFVTIFDSAVNATAQYGAIFGVVSASNMAAISAANAEAASYGEIPTRNSASNIISDVDDLSKDIREAIEDIEAAGDFSSSYEMSLSLENTITDAIGGLIDQSLNLPAERILILDKEIPAPALVHELYGNLDNLDLFMEYNNLCCDEIVLIPRGREVRYYFG